MLDGRAKVGDERIIFFDHSYSARFVNMDRLLRKRAYRPRRNQIGGKRVLAAKEGRSDECHEDHAAQVCPRPSANI